MKNKTKLSDLDNKPPTEDNILGSESLTSEIITDISECENLWHEFSPSKTIFDTWEFRYSFWKGYNHEPYFIVLKDNGVNVGLLPLWYEEDASGYFWFGSSW